MKLRVLLFIIVTIQYCIAKINKNKEYFHQAELWIDKLERKIEAEGEKCEKELQEVKERMDSQRLDYGRKFVRMDRKIDFGFKNLTRSGGMARQAGSIPVRLSKTSKLTLP